jgi:hypothetical protein
MLATLRQDFARLPELLALPAPPQPEPEVVELVVPEPELLEPQPDVEAAPAAEAEAVREPQQLGLFCRLERRRGVRRYAARAAFAAARSSAVIA